jgi:hypothetical protein
MAAPLPAQLPAPLAALLPAPVFVPRDAELAAAQAAGTAAQPTWLAAQLPTSPNGILKLAAWRPDVTPKARRKLAEAGLALSRLAERLTVDLWPA